MHILYRHTHARRQLEQGRMHALGVNTFCFPLIISIFALKLSLSAFFLHVPLHYNVAMGETGHHREYLLKT